MAASRSRTLLIATTLIWVVAYAAWTADWMMNPMPHLFERSMRRIPMCLFGMSQCLLIGRMLGHSEGQKIHARIANGVALSVVAALIYSAAGVGMFSLIKPLWGPMTLTDMLGGAIADAWVFLAWLALYFAISADAEARDSRLALADARTAEQRARNQALVQQINPHFLFNALNAVSGLILEGDGKRAERVTMALSALLRRSLQQGETEFVTLAEEIDCQARYLEIEEIRFEGRFRFVSTVDVAAGNTLVPSLILQPLIENAVKHGVARSTGLVTLTLSARFKEGMLQISIVNDAPGYCGPAPDTGAKIGQANTRHRALLLYGPAAELKCENLPRDGYRAVLSLPLHVSKP